MSEIILNNRVDFTATYEGEEITFSSNVVSTRILTGLEAVKTANKDIWVNGPLVYNVVITNTSGAQITDAVFLDELESVIELDTTADILVNGSPATYTYSANVISIGLPTIEAGASVTVTFQVLQA